MQLSKVQRSERLERIKFLDETLFFGQILHFMIDKFDNVVLQAPLSKPHFSENTTNNKLIFTKQVYFFLLSYFVLCSTVYFMIYVSMELCSLVMPCQGV